MFLEMVDVTDITDIIYSNERYPILCDIPILYI